MIVHSSFPVGNGNPGIPGIPALSILGNPSSSNSKSGASLLIISAGG